MRNYPTERKRRNSDTGIQMCSTDSGRQNAVAWEKNDCTVRAYATAFELDYLEAWGKLTIAGRKGKKGFNFSGFMMHEHSEINFHPRPNMTVAKFVQFIAASGNWIIHIKHHVFAVKNGVIYDTYPADNLNRHVLGAWKVRD